MDKRASHVVETSSGLANGLDRLTERERECLRLVDRHMSSKEIARELGLSKHTVDWHLDKARRRLGAPDRYAAARLAFDRSETPSAANTPLRSDRGPTRRSLAMPSRYDPLNASRQERSVIELNPHQRDAVGRVAHLQEDIRRFQRDWPTLNSIHDMAPQFSWSQLTRQLSSLSANPANAAMVPELISATRKQAPFKPTEMVLREILSIACAVMDETFPADQPPESFASPDSEEDPMA